MALARRLITEGQLEECLTLQKESGQRLGEVLVEKGYLTQEEVFEIIRLQHNRKVGRGPGAPTLSFGLKVNDAVDGYFVKREIASSRLGATFDVVKDQQNAALKIMNKEHGAGQGPRFREAARAFLGLPELPRSIAQIYGEGLCNGSDYVLSEWFSVGDLRTRLGQGLPSEDALEIILSLTEGFAFAHGKNVIHGDLRPRKIMLRGDGSFGIRDFSFAPFIVSDPEDSKRSERRYLAPEQLTPASDCGPRTDVYALGLVYFELLTGQSAFEEKDEQLCSRIRQGRSPRVRKLKDEVPKDVESVIGRCLATLPNQRYGDASALLEDLRCLKDGRAVRAQRMRSTRKIVGWLKRWFNRDETING
ncbi:MAG: protein kinase [Planctomycetota bacterium]|nr:protein kinase [Planctomycetota bacterium]